MRWLGIIVVSLLWCATAHAQTDQVCVTSPSQTANYNQLCISASASGGSLQLTNFGSATGALSINANIILAPTASSLTQAINTTQSAAGTTAANCASGTFQFPCLNLFSITSDVVNAASPSDALDGWQFSYVCCGSAAKGARQAVDSIFNFNVATNSSNANREYVAIVGQTNVNVADAGSGGSFFGGNFVVRGTTASTILGVVGLENDLQLSGTATSRVGFSAVSLPGGVSMAGQASTYDTAYSVGAQTGTNNVGWINATLLSHLNGRAPLDATNGCVICTDGNSDTIKTGIDLSTYTISGNSLNFPHFFVTGTGVITSNVGANNFIGLNLITTSTHGGGFTIYDTTTGGYQFSWTGGALAFSTVNGSGAFQATQLSLTTGGVLSVLGVLQLVQATWADNQTCTAGQISVDAGFIYVCTATNTVKRVAISSF